MLHERPPLAPRAERIARLTAAIQGKSGIDLSLAALRAALDPALGGRIALVSSFGADSVVLLDMVAQLNPALPVLFIDTELLFPETLQYQRSLAAHLGLKDIRVIRAPRAALLEHDADGLLYHFDPDACCALRKVAPLARALDGFDGWITGRKRYQAGTRADMPIFEEDDAGRIKINPLALWQPGEAARHVSARNLPRHPLLDRGYRSIGCAPCTTPVREGEDERAGRWRGRGKIECGLHRAAPADGQGEAA